ncbi:BrxE family protein [Pleomorphochaeta sp. DL1XJH-081]|uniref:BrxE family protein n=1 Tax=Pleomorphochaeta sp. DL1XJH-081 TaxID=3409690 RepID=UPI003BB505A5
MNDDLWIKICKTRLVVGYLGEKNQNAWWDCNFLSASSKSFLIPVFPKTMALAQYHGVCRAAAIVHDDHIGIGKHFHLYRLPDSIERHIIRLFSQDELIQEMNSSIESQDSAIRYLEKHSVPIQSAEGPVVLGEYSDYGLSELLPRTIANYFLAFTEGRKVFPFYRNNA